MPFRCGEKWKLSTYSGHNPDDKKLDITRTDGATMGGTAVASAAGKVTEWIEPGGVEVNHGNGWFTVYLHMSSRVPVGTQVGAGQRLGTVGSVGTSTPHLHYEQLFDSNGNNDAITDEMVNPVIQGQRYALTPGQSPVVASTNGCSGTPPNPAPTPPSPAPTQPGGRTKYWVDTYANATGFTEPNESNPQGTLYAGTNYVWCKAAGVNKRDEQGNYNIWWLLTDLDQVNPGGRGTNVYVSALYLTKWGNNQAFDNQQNDIPNCGPTVKV